MSIADSEFENNVSKIKYGGGIYFDICKNVSMHRTIFNSNTAYKGGGVGFSDSEKVEI